jgi:hypothetical protein
MPDFVEKSTFVLNETIGRVLQYLSSALRNERMRVYGE